MKRSRIVRAALAGVAVTLAATAEASAVSPDAVRAPAAQTPPAPDPAGFSATVNNPLFPVSTLRFTRMRGHERGESGRRITITARTRRLSTSTVAGFPVTVVRDEEFENGRLTERTLDYYGQDSSGNVWYFGERIDEFENGRLSGHEGQWLAGRRGAQPGLFMPAHPRVRQTFQQERAPRVAEDRSTVVALGIRVHTPARTFGGCIKVRDFSPIDRTTEFKFYCPGVGIAREVEAGGHFDVVRFA